MIRHIVLPWCPVWPGIGLWIVCSLKSASSRNGIRTVKAQQWPCSLGCEHKISKPWLRCGSGDLQPTCCRTNSIRAKKTGSSLWVVSSRFPAQRPCLQALTPVWLLCLTQATLVLLLSWRTMALWTHSRFYIGGLFQTLDNMLLLANLVSVAFLQAFAIV